MNTKNRRIVLIIGALAVVVTTLAGVLLLWPEGENKPVSATSAAPKPTAGPSPVQVVDSFLQALSAGSAAQAAAMTDNPAAAETAIAALAKNVPAGTMKFTRDGTTGAQSDGGAVKVPVRVTITVSSANEWKSSMDLVRTGDKWVVKWAPTVIHPQLAEGQSIAVLGQVVGQTGKPAVLGEDGNPIMVWQGATAEPTDPKISPLLLKALVSGGGGGPGDTDTRHISIIDGAGKEVGQPLFGTAATPASTEPIKSTVNAKVSVAAQNAVAKATQETMIVAIKPSTGGILAVAHNGAAGSASNALNGLYPPGSAFKIITATAAIQQGMSLDSGVQCPGQVTVGGRTLKNAGFDLGAVKLRTAFARSCNTTFGEIAGNLQPDDLKKAADQFGLNADYSIPGISTELGKVEPAGSIVQRVEDSIGQGNIKASPLGMAVVAATVAAKRPITPQLRGDAKTQVVAGYNAPSAAVLGQLQTMMREVVTSGTATALTKFNASGKTGTAETENQGDNAHGWFVGYRGDVAFAVLVVDGKTSSLAVNVAAAFLGGL
ncbi:beta-lactamase class D [Kibdelosporangium banguiense]|uniref:Beta-lactamase class D n=1 Tax=Kibdelosporangium banguiense TaxID=1365924 RepID=A0ABS4THW7_9PSEU|nr:penicillin-binding transpeptidase domain-containing protein [Kibdelosporangium banguiense]MBP2324025.1 beta-lactamase class D [Kibdelosporangium banguiense]